jgi:two-component system, cell cycle response regulator DivK
VDAREARLASNCDESEMKKVLVVEDDADTRQIYTTMLAHSGYDVTGAANGADGVRLALEIVPDLILMNLALPVVNGLSATAMLRRDPRTADIPIIACTGFVSEDGREDAEDAGCDAYLEKPCEPTRLVEEVEKFIGKPVAAM